MELGLKFVINLSLISKKAGNCRLLQHVNRKTATLKATLCFVEWSGAGGNMVFFHLLPAKQVHYQYNAR
jgi:hypothetical protein